MSGKNNNKDEIIDVEIKPRDLKNAQEDFIGDKATISLSIITYCLLIILTGVVGSGFFLYFDIDDDTAKQVITGVLLVCWIILVAVQSVKLNKVLQED